MNDYKDLIQRLKLSVENPLAGEAINAIEALTNERDAAKTDIAALLWLDGQCKYCKFSRKDEYCGASRWRCELGAACNPEWRGVIRDNQ